MGATRTELRDRFGRSVRKARLSVTDRCQLRCRYCMPGGPTADWLPKRELLRFEEIDFFVQVLVTLGLREVRITGGEPLLRRDLARLVAMLRRHDLTRLALTTNGLLLEPQLPALLAAGLTGVTISLDTLHWRTFAELTGSRALERVVRAIEAASRCEAIERKLNCVLVRGINDHELPRLLEFAAARDFELRYIEWMPFGVHWHPSRVVKMEEILARLRRAFGPIEPLEATATARRFYVPRLGAAFGIVPALTEPFCGRCDRLRLSADGRLLTCLFEAVGRPLRDVLRSRDAEAVRRILLERVRAKGPGYLLAHAPLATEEPRTFSHMHATGG